MDVSSDGDNPMSECEHLRNVTCTQCVRDMPRLARCQKLASVQANCKSLGASLVPGCCLVQATLPSSAWNLNELPLLSVRLTLGASNAMMGRGLMLD